MKKWRNVQVALKLYRSGKSLERTRNKLERLYLTGEPNGSPKTCKARKRFNRLCDRWNELENTYLQARENNDELH